MNDESNRVTTASLPGSTTTAVVWRSKGRLSLTVMTKATFGFVPDARMRRVSPHAFVRAEAQQSDVWKEAVLLSDRAPHLARTDVLFTGGSSTPTNQSGVSSSVRLAIFAGQQALLDKTVEVPEGKKVVGFGPTVRRWPLQKQMLAASIMDIPDDFDWRHFQVAPPDQWIEYLRGDEWIILEGLHSSAPRVRTCLPGALGLARVYGLSFLGVAEGTALPLVADTLRIDGNAQLCTVLWRRSIPLANEDALERVRIVAGVEIAGEALVWPEPPPAKITNRPPAAGKPAANAEATVFWAPAPLDGSERAFVPIHSEPDPEIEVSGEETFCFPLLEAPMGTGESTCFVPEGMNLDGPALPFLAKPTEASTSAPPRAIPGAPWLSPMAPSIPATPVPDIAASTLCLDVLAIPAAEQITWESPKPPTAEVPSFGEPPAVVAMPEKPPELPKWNAVDFPREESAGVVNEMVALAKPIATRDVDQLHAAPTKPLPPVDGASMTFGAHFLAAMEIFEGTPHQTRAVFRG